MVQSTVAVKEEDIFGICPFASPFGSVFCVRPAPFTPLKDRCALFVVRKKRFKGSPNITFEGCSLKYSAVKVDVDF